MRYRLEGKRAVVTGGSKGIGAAIVARLVEDGATVHFTYRSDLTAAANVVNKIGNARVSCSCVDALDEVGMTVMFNKFGPLDILVNNVGGAWLAKIEEMTEMHCRLVLQKNVYSLVVGTREGLKHMTRGGSVVNISSVVADLNPVGPGMGMYNAAKAAVVSLTKTFAKELGPRGIRVNTVSPGPTDTEGVRPRLEEMLRVAAASTIGHMSAPQDVAAAVSFLASSDASMVTGEVIRVSGGLGCE